MVEAYMTLSRALKTACPLWQSPGAGNKIVFTIDQGRMHFGHITGVGLNHLQLFFRKLLAVSSC
jgi:hypothetical protein